MQADVLAWASGTPNYGWGIVPTGNDGTEIASFQVSEARRPILLLEPGDVRPALQAGDADQDLDFDVLDVVQVQLANKYLSGSPANWSQGDWNGAPSGNPGNPPTGDGLFDQLDIIAALGAGAYLTGPYAAINKGGMQNDGQTSIVYDPNSGELAVDSPVGTELTSVNIDSASGIFTGAPAANLGGSFDNDSDNNIFKATFGSPASAFSVHPWWERRRPCSNRTGRQSIAPAPRPAVR